MGSGVRISYGFLNFRVSGLRFWAECLKVFGVRV